MKKLKVPVLAMRLVLMLFFLLAMLLAFVVGSISGSDSSGSDDIRQRVIGLFKKSGLVEAVSLSGQTNYQYLMKDSAQRLSRQGRVLQIALYKEKDKSVFWRWKPKGYILSDSIRANLWAPYMHYRLIEERVQLKCSFFVVPFEVKQEKYLALLFMPLSDGLLAHFSDSLQRGVRRVWRIAEAQWKKFLLLFAVFFLFAIFTGVFASTFWLKRPVRQFASLLDVWDSSRFSYKTLKGPMRYLMLHVVELVERTRQKDAVGNRMLLEQLLPVKFGYDYPGFSASAFFVRNLEEKKDYYDIFPLQDGRYALFMGEVSGAGEAASALMVRYYWIVRAYCRTFSNPAEVLSSVNKYFLAEKERLPINGFVGFFDPTKNELIFSQAGGLPVYRFDTQKGTVQSYHLDIPPMGLLEPELFNAKLSFARLPLLKGELLGLFTDGILKMKEYDWESRVKEIFSAKTNLGEKVIALRSEIQERVGSDRRQDDVAGMFIEA